MPRDRAKVMAEFARPTTNGLRCFLGIISYYRKLVNNIAEIISLLTPATPRMAPAHVVWTNGIVSAFTSLTKYLVNVCILTVPLNTDSYFYRPMPLSLVYTTSGINIIPT